MVKYYIDDLKTKLIKSVGTSVYVYNFIKQEWKESDFWFNEINFEGAINCSRISEEAAEKIVKGEKYAINQSTHPMH